MELEPFVKEAIVGIANGVGAAQQAGVRAKLLPAFIQEKGGVEFDLGINIRDGKIEVVGVHTRETASRIKFSVVVGAKAKVVEQ
jgi:hypothetical protein